MKATIFDLDGVLLNSMPTGMSRFTQAAQSFGLPINDTEIARAARYLGTSVSLMLRDCWPEHQVNVDEFYERWEKIDAELYTPLFDEVPKLLTTLTSAGQVLGAYTNRGWSARVHLERTRIMGFFANITAVSGTPHPKEDPRSIAPLLADLKDLGVSPEDIVFVGDTVSPDLACARNVGLRFIAAGYGVHSAQQFLAAGVPKEDIIATPMELLEKL